MQALSIVRRVTFRLGGQPERRGMVSGCPDAPLVPRLVITNRRRHPEEGC